MEEKTTRIRSFEDLKAWQKGRDLVREIYKVSSHFRDKTLTVQIRRSALSVPSNIAEGFARRTKKEFVQFLYIAHGSIAEVQSQLYAAIDLDYISQSEFERLYSLCEECSRLVMGLIKYLRNSSLEFHASATPNSLNSQTQRGD